MSSGFRVGPFGAVAVTVVDGALIAESRISIAGFVPQFLSSNFYPNDAKPFDAEVA